MESIAKADCVWNGEPNQGLAWNVLQKPTYN